MPHPDTLALLREALDMLNDRPNFGLRRDPNATSYKLAARIDAHIATLEAQASHPAIGIACRLWSDDDHVEVDQGEQEISEGEDGVWVRAWLLVDTDNLPPDDEPDPPPVVQQHYRAATGALPSVTRAVFLLHRVEELDYPAIAERLSISVGQVEQHVASALAEIDRVITDPAAD